MKVIVEIEPQIPIAKEQIEEVDSVENCPFCGNNLFTIKLGRMFSRVFCRCCAAEGPLVPISMSAIKATVIRSIEAWNERVEQ